MNNDALVRAGLIFIIGGITFYAGYLWGTYRMGLAYGEAASAEALFYLAALDAEGEN